MRRSLVLLFAILVAGSALGDEPPQFFIESITIEGIRWTSPAILIAESKLDEGREYSEPQLRDAIARIRRLPFVIDTDFRLEKGSERGRFRLVITVAEAKPLFAGYRALHESIDTQRTIGIIRDPETGTLTPITEKELFRHNEESATFGGRWFVGSKGLVHASVDRRGETRYNLGYTHYDILGTRASVSVLAQYREYSFAPPNGFETIGRTDTSFGDHLSWEVAAAVPLSGNHAIRASWSRLRYPYLTQESPSDPVTFNARRFYDDRLDTAWVYDTTNDLIFATRGVYAKAGVLSRKLLDFEPVPEAPNRFEVAGYEVQHELEAQLIKYWELTQLQSISLGGVARTINDRDYEEIEAHLAYSANLLGRVRGMRDGELRFEAETERIILRYADTSSYGTARAGLAFRNSWGVVRLDLRYIGWRQRP